MPTLQRLEVWDNLQCDGGQRLAVVPLDHVTRCVTSIRTTRDDEATIEVSKDIDAYQYLSTDAVVRWLYTDGEFDEWRVRDITDTSRSVRIASIGLQSPLMDLNTSAAVISATANTTTVMTVEWKALTPAEVLANILAFCPSTWAAGTVTPTIPVNITTSAWMPLKALRELVNAIRAQGVSCELDYRRNGTTGYYIDLVTSIGASAASVDVRTAKNLLATTRRRSIERYATEVIPVGASGATVARAYLEVTAKSGSTLTVQSPVTGGNLIAFDGQFDGLYLIDDANAKQLISASGVDQQFDVASAANVTATRWYRLAANSSGDELVRVRKAPATAGPIKVVTSTALDDTTNIVPNPAMRVWSGASSAPPDGWSQTGVGTLTRTTSSGLWLFGGKSCRIQSTNLRLFTPTLNIYVPSWATSAVMSIWVYITTASTGDARFTVDGVLQSTATYSSYATGRWHRIDYTHDMTALVGAVRSFQLSCGGGSSDSYMDSVQVTFTSAARPFVEGSSPARLLALANQYLTTYGTVPVSYTVQFADLGAWDASQFPYDTVTLGASSNVRDTDLNITTTARLIDLTRDWRDLLSSSITVSTRPADLVSTLTGIADL